MSFKFEHYNYNVVDLEKSLAGAYLAQRLGKGSL